MVLWRITTRTGRDAVSGEGTRRYGGRWNRPGLPAVYTSEHLSLAALESLVHLDTDTPVRASWVIRIELPDDLPATDLVPSELQSGWEAEGSPICEGVGNAWLETGATALLLVPSALIAEERNAILNPQHAAFDEGIPHEVTRQFSFDRRLLG